MGLLYVISITETLVLEVIEKIFVPGWVPEGYQADNAVSYTHLTLPTIYSV